MAALAFSWEKAPVLIPLICGIGVLFAVITIANIFLATMATQSLLEWKSDPAPQQGYPRQPPVIGLNLKDKCPLLGKHGIFPYVTSLAGWKAIIFIIAWGMFYCKFEEPKNSDKAKLEIIECSITTTKPKSEENGHEATVIKTIEKPIEIPPPTPSIPEPSKKITGSNSKNTQSLPSK